MKIFVANHNCNALLFSPKEKRTPPLSSVPK